MRCLNGWSSAATGAHSTLRGIQGGSSAILKFMSATEWLRCPATGLQLREISTHEAGRAVGHLQAREGAPSRVIERLLLRSDDEVAYPVVDGVPILLTPEALSVQAPVFDLTDVRWAEAYAEMAFYNYSAQQAGSSLPGAVAEIQAAAEQSTWPNAWLDAPYDAASQLEVLRYLGQPTDKTILQLGGHGGHAVKMLAAGAAQAWLVTPMLSEALYGIELARVLGFADRFHAAVGIAEQIPLADGMLDAVYTGGCLHHMATEYAGPEIYRVLKTGGRFGAVEPWQTSLHKYGTRLIGKREANAYCRPLTSERIEPMRTTFRKFSLEHHAPILRYGALALQKLTKHAITPRTGLRLTSIDDRFPLPREMGGSIAVLAER